MSDDSAGIPITPEASMDHRTELRALVELDRAGNVRRAADALGISQSTLSDAVARMERAYGTPLFDRDQRGSRATVCGRIVVDAAARSLEILDNAHREAGLLVSGERATLAIGADPVLVEAYVVPAIAAILEDHVALQIRVHSGSPDDLLRLLRERQIELFLGFRPDGPLAGVSLEEVATLAGVPFARIGHPLATVPPQGIRVLRDFPYVCTHMPRWYHERLLTELPDGPATMESLVGRHRLIEKDD
jgi:DNA-binding transcriptional LysR family regulator